MAENYFELVGRVGWIECKCLESGMMMTKCTIGQNTGKKDAEGKYIYENFFVTFFNSPEAKYKVAEDFADENKKGDYIKVKGILKIDKFIPEGSPKAVERLSLIGRAFNKVRFDEFEKQYVDV